MVLTDHDIVAIFLCGCFGTLWLMIFWGIQEAKESTTRKEYEYLSKRYENIYESKP